MTDEVDALLVDRIASLDFGDEAGEVARVVDAGLAEVAARVARVPEVISETLKPKSG